MAASGKEKSSNKTQILIGGLSVVWSDLEKKVNVTDVSTNKEYLIDGKKVIGVDLIHGYDLVVFQTVDASYFRDLHNSPILHSESWEDYFYEPITSSFYRQDSRGFWYDIHGFRIESTIILKDNVLISLNEKIAKQNMLFLGCELIASPNQLIIQIGKSILNERLETIYHFSDKLTGLGQTFVLFEDGIIYQEVKLSMRDSVYINEQTKQPILINGDCIKSYVKCIKIGKEKYHLFRSEESTYLLNVSNHQNLELHATDHEIDESTYIKINKEEIIKVVLKKGSFYVQIASSLPYFLEAYPTQKVRNITRSNVTVNNIELLNLELDDIALVVNSANGTIFKLASGILPERIKNIPGFENTLALVFLDGKSYLYSLLSETIVEIGSDNLTIQATDGYLNNKLINATDQNGRKVVLDVREGYADIKLAKSNQKVITEMIGLPRSIGSKILQNARIETLGGTQRQVIDLNDPELSVFAFPNNMSVFNEGESKSVFSSTPLISIDFKSKINIEDQTFFVGQFRSYDEELQTVILQSENGKPLYLEGAGHKNELVTGFSPYTMNDKFLLGSYRMIGVSTLREDLKSNEILFALELMSSWIPFYDTYLPIFKKVVELNDRANWEYNLFELGEVSTDKEYIAVEKISPYRILIKKKGSKRIPKVVKSREKILKSPEEISMIKKLFFEDPGVLEEV